MCTVDDAKLCHLTSFGYAECRQLASCTLLLNALQLKYLYFVSLSYKHCIISTCKLYIDI